MLDAPPLPRRRRLGPTLPILSLGAVAALVLLYLGRSMTFFQDEWGSIAFSGGPIDLIRPVNEHWSTIPLLLYRATFAVVGLHSYLPYIVQVIALHLIAVAAAYVLIRRRAGWIVATLACIPLLFLGSGSENLFWAFQTGFIGSVAFGLWGLVALERSGRASAVAAAILLLLSLMSQGTGLFFLVAAFGRTLLDPAIRPRTAAVIPPAIAYAVWYVAFGRNGVAGSEPIAGVGTVLEFVARGIGFAAVGQFTGLGALPRGGLLGLVAFGAASVATGVAVLRSHRPPALAAGSLLAVVAMYTIIGLVRAELPSDFATRSRYVYVAAFFLVLAVADWLPLLRDWTEDRPGARLLVNGALALVLVAAIVANVAAFGPIRARFQANADLTRAYIGLALANRGASWIDPASPLLGMPSVPDLVAIVDRSGSPLHDDLVPGVVKDPGAAARERALLRMVGTGFHAEPGVGAGQPGILTLVGVEEAAARPDGLCVTVTAMTPKATIAMEAASGSRIRVTPTNDATSQARLGLTEPSLPLDLTLAAGAPTDIVVPDVGDGSTWIVELELPEVAGPVGLCRV
jgi:hypothetical protein